jgi:hypothetical protein
VVVVFVEDVVAEEVQFLVFVVNEFEDEFLHVFLIETELFVGVECGGELEQSRSELFGEVFGDAVQIEVVELFQVEGQQQIIFYVSLCANRNRLFFENGLYLLNQLFGQFCLLVLLVKGVFGVRVYFVVGAGLQSESVIVCRDENVVFDSTFDAALSKVEGVVGIVIKVDFFVFLLHAREAVLLFSGVVVGHKLFIGHVGFGVGKRQLAFAEESVVGGLQFLLAGAESVL